MQSKTYQIPEIGELIILKHPKAKRITLKVRPQHPPKVVIPYLMNFNMGLRFAQEKTQWIQEHQQLLNNNYQQKIYNDSTVFKTRYTEICFILKGNKLKAERNNNSITLYIPEGKSFDSPIIQNLIKKFITEVLRGEAKKHLPAQTEKFALMFGFKINSVMIKNHTSRWGSCSATNNINLNLHVMRLPEHLSDFIILHELCHTIHKNHGPKFHELLNTLTGGNEKTLNNELKRYTIAL